jgi:hypothetical protein
LVSGSHRRERHVQIGEVDISPQFGDLGACPWSAALSPNSVLKSAKRRILADADSVLGTHHTS